MNEGVLSNRSNDDEKVALPLVDVILLCGGRGTRFRAITEDKVPKSLYRLNDVELMQFSLNVIDFSLVNKLIFAVDYRAADIKRWVERQNFPCQVVFSTQTEDGVFGGITAALDLVDVENFIVCNTDEVREGLSMEDLLRAHTRSDNHLVTMATADSDHLYWHRVVNSDADRMVVSSEYRSDAYRNLPHVVKEVNAGFTVFNIEAVRHFDARYGRDWSAVVDPLIEKGLMRSFMSPGTVYFNVGTVNELEGARTYFANKKSTGVQMQAGYKEAWQ